MSAPDWIQRSIDLWACRAQRHRQNAESFRQHGDHKAADLLIEYAESAEERVTDLYGIKERWDS